MEHGGTEAIGLQQAAQQHSRPEKVLLADKLGQRSRAHASRQRLCLAKMIGFGLFKQRGHYTQCTPLAIARR